MRLCWIICTVARVVAVSGSVALADQTLRVHNSGFEKFDRRGMVSSWELDDDASSGEFAIAAHEAIAHGGRASFKIEAVQPATVVVVSNPVELRVGQLYRLSGWLRCANVQSDQAARYPTAVPACLSMASFPFTNHSPALGGTAEWTRVETLFIATRQEDRIRLHLGHNGTARGTAWFDDIHLERVDDIAEFIPLDTVKWCGNGYRYDDRGWIFVHIEGAPYERGYQYGALVADEIVEYIRKLSVQRNGDDSDDGWDSLRFEADALFLRGYDKEYLTEMTGIADGAASTGAKVNDRPVDLVDIVTINSVIDLGQLKRALQVTPHALTGESFLEAREEMQVAAEDHKCSAFAATGPATAGGEVVFGQIFMWGGYTGVHWNVITDIVPTDGHRLVYHTFPGGIHSGADFYINAAGIIIGETTVSQTPFEPDSTPQSNRIRKAAQYASTIDDVERLLWEGNNGMYTNDWPIADIKTGEAAILLLGTQRKKLWRTSEDMAPFGTPGFLWANNNNRDREVRKEYLAQPEDRPFDLVFSPWNRDVAFCQFYDRYKGRIDATTAVRMWASSPINRAHACDGKITTTAMARELAFLAHYGKVTLREKFPQKGYRIMPDLPGATPHLSHGYAVASPIFVTDQLQAARAAGRCPPRVAPPSHQLDINDLAGDFTIDSRQLWRRTVFPATAAENWFVSASAAYWRLLNSVHEESPAQAAAHLSDELASLNRRYLYTVARERDLLPLEADRVYSQFGPYQIPRIKGTFALHQLRLHVGSETFLKLMRALHDRFAEQEMSNAQCTAMMSEIAGGDAVLITQQWLERLGLPELEPTMSIHEATDGRWEVSVRVVQGGRPYHLITHVIVDTSGGRHVRRMALDGPSTVATWSFDEHPTRIEFNALNDIPTAHDNMYTWSNLIDDFHDTLIVYGTARQDEANHTLARRWQETVANAYIEFLPPLVKDSELTAEQAAGHDLIVMGTLDDNRWLNNLELAVPVEFGRNHFTWRGVTYAAPEDGIFLVVPNPYNRDRVMYIVAANSALQLYHMTARYERAIPSWALFKAAEIVEQGYHPPARFVLEPPVSNQQAAQSD